jgi:hypothetical protein
MEREVKIYVLKNPTTNNIHYVGRSFSPDVRYRMHIHLAKKSKHKNKKDAWICSLLKIGLKPKMEIIDITTTTDAINKERYWIETLKETCDLKNCRDYTENNYLFSEESRKKMSEAAKRTCNRRGTKTSEEGRINIGNSKRGIKQNKEHIEKKSKKLLQYEKNGTFVKEWENSVVAGNTLKISQGNISMTALGYRKSAGGYIWKFKNKK